MRRALLLLISLIINVALFSQSRSIEKFRKAYQEDENVFFYSSTLKMLNMEGLPDFEDIVKDIDKIAVLIYKKENQKFTARELYQLTKNLEKEKYVELMIINDKGNKINLYKKEKRGRTTGFAAFVDNKESLVLIDVKGSIDFKKFMELKNQIDLKL